MRIRNEWMTDNIYFGSEYPNNILLDDAIKRFEIQRDESLDGRDSTIDDVYERIVVQNHTNPLNQAKYDKKILFSFDSDVHTGSVLKFDDKTWLVVSKIFDRQAYKVASVLECINTLTFYKSNITNIPIEIPYIIFDNIALTRMGVENNQKYMSIPDSRMMLMVSDNYITRHIERNDIFQLYDKDDIIDNYKIIDVNRLRNPGLIIFEMEWCSESQEIPEEIPNDEIPEVGIFYVLDGNDEIKLNQTKTYIATKYNNGTSIVQSFTFSIIAGSTPSDAYQFNIVDGNNCSIKALKYNYSIILRATDNSDITKHVDKIIQLKSLI